MKNLIWVTFALLSSAGYAQENKKHTPPATVSDAFKKTFAGSEKVKWEKEKGGYEVGFIMNGKEMSAVYDAKAELLETETVIKPSELPVSVQQYLQKNYKSASVKEAAKIVNAQGELTYEAEVNKKDLIFDSKGKFLKVQAD